MSNEKYIKRNYKGKNMKQLCIRIHLMIDSIHVPVLASLYLLGGK